MLACSNAAAGLDDWLLTALASLRVLSVSVMVSGASPVIVRMAFSAD